MPTSATARLGLTAPVGTDNVSVYPALAQAQLPILDNAAIWLSGTLAARPAANAVAQGTFYYATDVPAVYASNGVTWSPTGLISSRGATTILGPHSTSSTSYVTLSTPDQVTVQMPSNGLIVVTYQATWQESVIGGARASIFLGSGQLQILNPGSVPPLVTQGAALVAGSPPGAVANVNRNLFSAPFGLASIPGQSGFSYSSDSTAGQVVGALPGSQTASVTYHLGESATTLGAQAGNPAVGVAGAAGSCTIFADPGSYVVSVKFRAISGSVTASNRKLWCQAIPFA